MGTELTTEMASLALAPSRDEVSLILATREEIDLTEEQFAIVERIANSPPPAIPMATDNDVRKVIGSLAGILKAPRISRDQGKLQLGLYRKALVGVLSAEALEYAGNRALATLQWMPTPAELIDLAKGKTNSGELVLARAQRLARDRRNRIHDETIKALRDRLIPESELSSLPRATREVAKEKGILLHKLDGSLIYWTLQEWTDDLQARRERLQDERGTRAREEGSDGAQAGQ